MRFVFSVHFHQSLRKLNQWTSIRLIRKMHKSLYKDISIFLWQGSTESSYRQETIFLDRPVEELSIKPWPILALETFRRHFDLFETFDFLDFLSFLSDSNPSLSSSLSDILIGYRLSSMTLFLTGIETGKFLRFWISSRSDNLFISRLWLISPTSKML